MAAWVYEGMKPIDRKYRTWGGEPSVSLTTILLFFNDRPTITPSAIHHYITPDSSCHSCNNSYFHSLRSCFQEKLMYGAEYAGNLTDHDTIFVSYAKIEEFVNDFLPYINTTFVLITVPFHIMYPPGLETVANKIIHHDHLLHWFATNIGNYTGGYQFHPKVSPFPLGLKPKMGSRDFQNPIPFYRQVFLNAMNQTTTAAAPAKDRVIFAGYISRTNQNRNAIPSGPKLQYTQYLLEIAKSSYVISPNGDHPDCHRHYESLGLGAIPITQLDPYLYSHLMEGPVIYNNTNWNLTELEESLPIPAPDVVNRNMIFEEYWMEYVEGVVGHPLNWWDVKKGKRLKLQDF
jgi:hypothetical protein